MSKMMSDEERLISKKANYHKYGKVHLKLKNGGWENGIIQDVGADFITIEFLDEGKKKWKTDTMVFFFLELKDIRQYGGYDK